MKTRSKRGLRREERNRFWKVYWRNAYAHRVYDDYWRVFFCEEPGPKLKRRKYYSKELSMMHERHCPKFWKVFHRRKYRAKLRQWFYTLDEEGYETRHGCPVLYRPWIYWW